MPPEARIAVIEDNPIDAFVTTAVLEGEGHRVVHSATTREEVLTFISNLPNLNLDCIITDANLTEGDVSGRDGQVIVGKIREINPDIPIIGCSANDKFENVDCFWQKGNLDSGEKTLEYIEHLPRR